MSGNSLRHHSPRGPVRYGKRQQRHPTEPESGWSSSPNPGLYLINAIPLSTFVPQLFISMLLLLQFLWLAVAHSAKNTAWNRPLSTNTNNFEFARDGPGTNGFLYTPSSAGSSGGPYNYCNMPHVAPSTYTSPDPNRYTLEYVEITHRHHRRTPYASNMFPREDRTWDCAYVPHTVKSILRMLTWTVTQTTGFQWTPARSTPQTRAGRPTKTR